ncbi:unnamed protein product [Soboliphyme baturini]|uniref:Uncharacterized protein n=1 Tax=Soboliphyme baturini TaxID=241478 RepID=A0A183IDN8_9BILA|nr:unnamed protein product [Soboliphyme baturini]
MLSHVPRSTVVHIHGDMPLMIADDDNHDLEPTEPSNKQTSPLRCGRLAQRSALVHSLIRLRINIFVNLRFLSHIVAALGEGRSLAWLRSFYCPPPGSGWCLPRKIVIPSSYDPRGFDFIEIDTLTQVYKCKAARFEHNREAKPATTWIEEVHFPPPRLFFLSVGRYSLISYLRQLRFFLSLPIVLAVARVAWCVPTDGCAAGAVVFPFSPPCRRRLDVASMTTGVTTGLQDNKMCVFTGQMARFIVVFTLVTHHSVRSSKLDEGKHVPVRLLH